jgi:hypothetical protein
MAITDVLDRERTVATHSFNRWLIPPAALAVHLCIGQAYATSVYKSSLVDHFDTSLTAIGIIFSNRDRAEGPGGAATASEGRDLPGPGSAWLPIAWVIVGVPLLYGVYETVVVAFDLFG